MNSRDMMKIKGAVDLKVIRSTGEVYTRKIKNIVSKLGCDKMAELLSGGTPAQVNHIALGSDGTAPTPSDTALLAELYRETAAISWNPGADGDKVQFQSSWIAGAAQGSLLEAGLFDADTGGNLFSRTVFTQLDIGAADTLIVTWTIQFVGV